MNWKYNKRTGRMEQNKLTGIDVTARQGGIMIEDHDKNIQFLINYGTSSISHCVGCTGRNIHLFNDNDARKIAKKVRLIAIGKGIDEMYFDWKTYAINYKNMRTNENHIYRIDEFNRVDKYALEELYLGKTIRIISLGDEPSKYEGKEGKIEYIDDIGQLHGTWGGLAVIPDVDSFEVIDEVKANPEIIETISEFGFFNKKNDIINILDDWWKKHENDYDKTDEDEVDNLGIELTSVFDQLNDDSEEFNDMCYHIAQVLLEQN